MDGRDQKIENNTPLLTQASEKLSVFTVIITYFLFNLYAKSFQNIMHLLIQWPSSINSISFNKWRWELFLLLLSVLCQPFRSPNSTVRVEETVQNTKDVFFILTIPRGMSMTWCLSHSICQLPQGDHEAVFNMDPIAIRRLKWESGEATFSICLTDHISLTIRICAHSQTCPLWEAKYGLLGMQKWHETYSLLLPI